MSAPSESTVAPRFGTLWRWRAIVAMISVAVFAAGWNVARWWRARVLVRGSGQPAIVRILRPGYDSLERFDGTSGKWQKFGEVRGINYWYYRDPIRVVLDGNAVAWHQDDTVHVAPVDGSPAWASKPLKLENRDEFLGLTRDEKFALFSRDGKGAVPLARGGVATTNFVIVVDLQTGEPASTETWVFPASIGSSGEIVGTRLSPESLGRWRFSSDGGWTKISDEEWRLSERQMLQMARGSDGQLSWHDDSTPLTAAHKTEMWTVGGVSPSGDRFIANSRGKQCALFDSNTGKVVELDLPWGTCPIASFTPNDNTLVISDWLDDIHVIDASTGQLVAKDSAGSRRRAILFRIATAGLLASVVWLWIAFCEQSTRWALVDAVVTTLLISLSLAAMATAMSHPGMNWTYTPADEIVRKLGYVVMGIYTGAAVATAWYWAHGDGAIAARWMRGALLLSVFLLPPAMLDYWDPWRDAILKFATAAVFTAGITAIMVSIPNAIGWTIRNRPLESSSRRFGLGAIFAAVTSIGMLLALGKWLFSRDQWNVYSPIFAYGIVELMLVGTVMVALLFVRLSWIWIVGGLLLVIATVYALNRLGLAGLSTKHSQFLYAQATETFSLIGMTLTLLITCLVLRRHGFRWTRGAVSPSNLSVVHT